MGSSRKETIMMDIRIRTATTEDAEELLEIYAYYIKNTAVTFEYEVPSLEEFQERIQIGRASCRERV